jgi:RNA polymerase sigma-70 factor (ECF subfamily)
MELTRNPAEGQQELAASFEGCRERLLRIVELRLDPRLRGRIDAADVLQDTFLAASERYERYRISPDAPLFLWLRFLAVQQVQQVHRQHLEAQKRDAGREAPLHGQTGTDSSWMSAALVASVTSPSQAALREERRAQLAAAMDGLESVDRELLALRHFEELSNNEAAAVLGLHASAASRRYFRALKQLKTALGGVGGFFEELGLAGD